jgi:hypothetical protein
MNSAIKRVETRILLGMRVHRPEEVSLLRAVHHRHKIRTSLVSIELAPAPSVGSGVIEDVSGNVLHTQLSYVSGLVRVRARVE